MKAGFKTGDCMLSVPEIRCGNKYRVKVLFIDKHLFIIFIPIYIMPVCPKNPVRSIKIIIYPYITNSFKPNTGYIITSIK